MTAGDMCTMNELLLTTVRNSNAYICFTILCRNYVRTVYEMKSFCQNMDSVFVWKFRRRRCRCGCCCFSYFGCFSYLREYVCMYVCMHAFIRACQYC